MIVNFHLTHHYCLYLQWNGVTRDSNGKPLVKYRLLDPDGRKLFGGADYAPSPRFHWASKESALTLLNFLTLQPGDTDEEYFADYTPRQLAWALEWGQILFMDWKFRLLGREDDDV